jgi:hypothetical protein
MHVPSAAHAQGNADAAHACQQGGYLSLTGLDGTHFKNAGQCTAFVARGGIIPGVNGCMITPTTGCATLSNTVLLQSIGASTTGYTLTGVISFDSTCNSSTAQGGQGCVYSPPAFASGGGTYTYTSGGVVTDTGTWSVTGETQVFYFDTSGSYSTCSDATGPKSMYLNVTLTSDSTSATSSGALWLFVDPSASPAQDEGLLAILGGHYGTQALSGNGITVTC